MSSKVIKPTWQKSSFSGEAANCVNVAAMPDHTLRLRESDNPDRILTVNGVGLAALLATIKKSRAASHGTS